MQSEWKGWAGVLAYAESPGWVHRASVQVCMCACVHVCAHSGKGGVSSKPCGSVAGAGRWLSGEAYRHAVRGKRQVDEEARLVPCLPGYSSRSGSTCIDHVVRRNLARARPLS